jgi:hypothetical protein
LGKNKEKNMKKFILLSGCSLVLLGGLVLKSKTETNTMHFTQVALEINSSESSKLAKLPNWQLAKTVWKYNCRNLVGQMTRHMATIQYPTNENQVVKLNTDYVFDGQI